MKHNNQLPNGHFHKQWQRRVKTWFDQPGRKTRRHSARVEKAARIYPRPTEALRPAVRCQTLKYNNKLRSGRGFTLDELKAAGISRKYARTVGISVDHRRRNKCNESLELNKERLLTYKARLVVFPKDASAPKKGDSSPELLATVVQHRGTILPINNKTSEEESRKIVPADNINAYVTLRKAWGIARFHGIRAKRAAEKAEADGVDLKKAK